MNYSKTNKQHRAATLGVSILTALTLTACGGGGGGSSSPEKPKAPAITDKPLSLTVGESQTVSRELDGNIDTASLTTIIENPAIEVDANGKTLSITIGELQNDGNARFTVQTSANSKYTVSINATNTSAAALLDQANTLTDSAAPNLMLADELRLQSILAELEYLAKEVSETQKAQSVDQALATATAVAQTTQPQIDALTQAVADYGNSQITEANLEQQLLMTQSVVQAYGNAGEQILSAHASTLTTMGLALPANLEDTYPLTYDADLERYTRFTHADFGTLNGDSFDFNATYDFFNTVFPYAK